MKKFLFVVFAFVLTLSIASVASAELKIGVVDIIRVLNESEEGKKAVAQLQSMLEERQKTLEEKQKKLQGLKEEFEKKRSVLSEDARKAKEDEIDRLGRELQRTAADYQVELQKKQNEFTQSMFKEIRQLINEYAQKEGYSLILEKADQIILFTTPEVDITDKIISIYNQKMSQQKGKK